MSDLRDVKAADIRRTANLLALLGPDAKPKKTASNRWLVRCPFHEDSTASLSVSFIEAGWVYRCFGCGEQGDVIRFVMKSEGCSFIDALRKLANSETAPAMSAPPVLEKKAFVIPCCMPGCGQRVEVDAADVPHLGRELHTNWTFRGARDRVAAMCDFCARGIPPRRRLIAERAAKALDELIERMS